MTSQIAYSVSSYYESAAAELETVSRLLEEEADLLVVEVYQRAHPLTLWQGILSSSPHLLLLLHLNQGGFQSISLFT